MPSRIASLGEADLDPLALDQDLAAIGLMHAGQYLDQRRLAGAVVADQPDHLARASIFRLTFFSACTPEYHLCRPRHSMIGRAHA